MAPKKKVTQPQQTPKVDTIKQLVSMVDDNIKVRPQLTVKDIKQIIEALANTYPEASMPLMLKLAKTVL